MKMLVLVFCSILVISGSYIFGQSKFTLSERILNNSIQTTLDSCPVGPAINPFPENGATEISPYLPFYLLWENGENATAIEVYFGLAGNMTNIYSGVLVDSIPIYSQLEYFENYQWKVVCMNDTCNALAETWTFRTIPNPSIVQWKDDFELGTVNWTTSNDGGTCMWVFFEPPYPNLYTLPSTSYGNVFSADADDCGMGTTLLSTATINEPFDFTYFGFCWIEFDNDWQAFDETSYGFVEVSLDNTNWTTVKTYDVSDVRSSHELIDLSSFTSHQSEVYIRLRSVQPGWHWWWTIDNFEVNGMWLIPVELTSFTSSVAENDVTLNWQTATETNNQGFEVQRKQVFSPQSSVGNGEWDVLSFITGNGTTTEPQSYSFYDKKLEAGKYQYKLKQIDFDGTFEYSNIVEVEIAAPLEFSLEQNYPNPFNPSTIINYQLPKAGNVTLKVYDVLGKEVATLVNEEKPAGNYEVEFDASNLASGVYYYQLRAGEFLFSKKMLLLK